MQQAALVTWNTKLFHFAAWRSSGDISCRNAFSYSCQRKYDRKSTELIRSPKALVSLHHGCCVSRWMQRKYDRENMREWTWRQKSKSLWPAVPFSPPANFLLTRTFTNIPFSISTSPFYLGHTVENYLLIHSIGSFVVALYYWKKWHGCNLGNIGNCSQTHKKKINRIN